MDRLTWIHADENLREINVLDLIKSADIQVKTAPGAKLIDNSFSIVLPENEWQKNPVNAGHYIYAPGTEWGGPVALVRHNTADGTITLEGPTWRGLLYQRRIYPPAGQGYLTFSNVDANTLISLIVGDSFGSLFTVTSTALGVLVSASYRYQSYADGLQDTLRDYGLRLSVVYDNARQTVVLSAQNTNDLTNDIEVSQDYGLQFISSIGNVEYANHCLALGSGELAEREVLNVYVTENGYTVSQPPTLATEDIRTILLDYPNAESTDALLKSAIKTLQEHAAVNGLTVGDLQDINAEMGDIVSVRDRVTGLVGTAEIGNKILTISNGTTKISMQIENVIVGGA